MSHSELIGHSQPEPDGVLAILARYSGIVDDFQSLLDAGQRPLPVCFWHNPLKGSVEQLTRHLTRLGIEPEPVSWMPGAFRVGQWRHPGATLAYTAGWYYVQEEIAMAAVVALDPQPGECVLDLCAAPGGKTAQIAARMPWGTVVANDIHAHRLPSLTVTVNRMGFTQVVTWQADGRSLGLMPGQFDRVLVDAPCSGEGNLRRRQRGRPWQAKHGLRMAAAQGKLLSRALDLVKPGGTVVYSTCTFAPEENEAVLDAVMGDRAEGVPFDIPGLVGLPGVTRWQGSTYRADVSHARRYFPHLNNTGGFFVAKLRRTAAAAIALPPEAHADTVEMPSVERMPLSPVLHLCQQFAIDPNAIAPYQCWATGRRRLWLADGRCRWPLAVPPQTVGLSLATQTNLGLKPSTAFLQRFGPLAQKNVVTLPAIESALKFLHGEIQPLTAAVEPGYVHVRFAEFNLGCGRYRPGWLESQLPKTLRWVAAERRH